MGLRRTPEQIVATVSPGVAPTPEQSEVIGAGLEPMLVVAGAGSGKTETLSLRMAYLLDHAEDLFGSPLSPDEILCLTFTRKAAAEIAERSRSRLDALFGVDPSRPEPAVSTYNAYAASLVAEHGLRVGVDPAATIISDAAAWQLADDIVSAWAEPLETDAAVSTLVAALPSFAAQIRDHELTPEAVRDWSLDVLAQLEMLPAKPGDQVPGVMKGALASRVGKLRTVVAMSELAEVYQRRKRERSLLDFADQVADAVQLAADPGVQAIERSRYRVVLLDEFQDTSTSQLRLFAQLFGPGYPVVAVGDPNQAIYGFRGASADALPQFVDAFGPGVVQRTLSVSWRNEGGVLEVANAAAEPLRDGARVHVKPLSSAAQYLGRSEPWREAASVTTHMAADLEDEADAAVGFIQARRAELAGPGGDVPTAAVLCRRRVQFDEVVEACVRAGVDYEVVGLAGLLDVPEVSDLVALLEVAHDPSRGDALMRLLTSERVALGPADLAALADAARELAGPLQQGEDRATIVDALAALPPEGWSSFEDRSLSDEARTRLGRLARTVGRLRSRTHLPLPELATAAIREWGLDIEASVAHAQGRGQRALDAFVDVVRSFAADAPHATLGALIAFLEVAAREEGGFDRPVKEPEPAAVQIMTVHAAKGLEWDIVVVPGMTQGSRSSQFPSVSPPSASSPYYSDGAWLSGSPAVPWELRMDAAVLPPWHWRSAESLAELGGTIEDFRAAAGDYRLEEERRLYYVALTRARSHVLLSGSWWGTATTPLRPSVFVADLIDSGLLPAVGWAAEPGPEDERPVRDREAPRWPRPASPAQAAVRELADDVRAAAERIRAQELDWDDGLPLARDVGAMLAEREERAAARSRIELPAHLSTSALVALRRDRDAFAVDLRRPVPTPPAPAAGLGTALHQWIERRFSAPTLIDTDELASVPLGFDGRLDELKAAFEASEWATRIASHIEVDVEVPVEGLTVRSRIDAVFPPGRGLERVTVVDWKSGRPPVADDDRRAREVQLSVYRLAWSAWTGVPLEDIDAAFYYVATGQTVFPSDLLERDEIVALLSGA